MLSKLWDSVSEELGKEWQLRSLSPAFIFWIVGLLLWSSKDNWNSIKHFFQTFDDFRGILIIITILFFVLVSNEIVGRLVLPTLQLFEGYWPGPFRFLRFGLTKLVNNKINKMYQLYDKLSNNLETCDNDLSIRSAMLEQERAKLYAELSNFPINPNHRMPTIMGNILRTSEYYPNIRYGLEVTETWPRLWTVMPEVIRKEMSSIRSLLDQNIRQMIWCILFAAWGGIYPWTIFFWIIIGISITGAVINYHGALSNAVLLSQFIKTAYDQNRFALYESIHFDIPKNFEDEVENGKTLTLFLRRGDFPLKAKSDQNGKT